MERAAIEQRVRAIVADVLEVEPGALDDRAATPGAPPWDSLQHLMIVLALEESFDIRMSDEEALAAVGIREIVSAVAAHAGAASAPRAALHPEEARALRVLFVRNYTLEPIEPLLRRAGEQAGLRISVRWSGYDPFAEPASLWDGGADAIVVALGLGELAPALGEGFADLGRQEVAALAEEVVAQIGALVARIRAASAAPIILQTFPLPVAPAAGLADMQDPGGQLATVRRINARLTELALVTAGAYVLDLDHLFARAGTERCWEERGARAAEVPFSPAGLRLLAEAQVRIVRALAGPAVRCIVVDCDNTLWGGVVGEDGAAGLVLGVSGPGRLHHDLQRRLLDLRRRGLVLAIATKNEPDDVTAVLREHPDMVLREADFAVIRAGWEEKASAVAEIAGELGLGLGHMAFLDDDPAECEWVRSRLPEVRVIRWPDDLGAGTLDDLGLFDTLAVTEEDRRRTELYRTEQARGAARVEAGTVEDHLRSLEMVATVGLARPAQLPRIAQLIAKTNQFNLTVRRHEHRRLEALASDPHRARVVSLSLSDRFGSSGLVGCGIVVLREPGVAELDTLLQSCRVIGRGAEQILAARLLHEARDLGALTLRAEYVPAPRNAQVADLLGRLGFARVDGNRYTIDLRSAGIAVPDWFTVVRD